MKKIIAILLSVLCIMSVFSVCSSALLGDLGGGLLEEEKGSNMIEYKKDTLSDVSMMYNAGNTLVVDGPCYAYVTKDTPIAVDHTLIFWVDESGNKYYPGDRIYVDGTVTLYAVWEEKTDKDTRIVRVIKTAIATLQRVVQKLLGVFDDAKEFEDEYWATAESAESEVETSATDVMIA